MRRSNGWALRDGGSGAASPCRVCAR
jgi:hypothetical protein